MLGTNTSECQRCHREVERLWLSGNEYICAHCKEQEPKEYGNKDDAEFMVTGVRVSALKTYTVEQVLAFPKTVSLTFEGCDRLLNIERTHELDMREIAEELLAEESQS